MGGSYAAAATALPPMLPPATYNAANQLTRWGGTVQSYDANGNLINDGVNLYMWNARNQLASITGLANANFQRDPSGRRVIKTVSGVTTAFLYDGPNIVQELSGSTPTANLVSGGLDEVFQRTDSTGARSFLTDALGSTLALTDSAGTLQSSYTFEPFGKTIQSGSPTSNSFAYTGRELDTDSTVV